GRVAVLAYAEWVELSKSRQLDATLQSSGLGMAAIRDLAAMMPINFIEIPSEVVAKIESPAYQPGVIPAGTYDGQDQDVATIAITNLLVTHEDVDGEDRKSTRLNSSHVKISYAVFCLKAK